MANRSFSNGFQFANSKSLNEQISDIVASRATKADKAKALFEIGLMQKEVSDILSVKVSRPATHKRFAFTFGVEIECITNCVAVENMLGRSLIHIENYNHDDRRDGVFKFVYDSSVRDNDGRRRYADGLSANEIGAAECVSPVLESTNGMKSLKRVIEAINENGGYVNRSCGLHVHIGAESLTGEQYVNVFKNYQRLESVIDSFMAPSRRGDCTWAKSLRRSNFDGCHTQHDVDSELSYDRYYKVNAESWARHHTIEFRQHQGTINFKKIQMWVRFLGKLVQYSLNNVLENDVQSVDEIPFLNNTEKSYFKARQQALA